MSEGGRGGGGVEGSPPADKKQEGAPSLGGEEEIDSVDGSSKGGCSSSSSSSSSGSDTTSRISGGKRRRAGGGAVVGGGSRLSAEDKRRARHLLETVKPSSARLPNGSKADGGSGGSGSGSSSNSGGALLEKAAAAAAVAARGAAREAALKAQGLWVIDEGRELEVSGQQACQSARATVKAWLLEEEPEWDAWMATKGRPSNQEAQEQLRRLRRQNRPGTLETAVKTMRRSVAKAVEAGKRRAQPTGEGTGKWQHLVVDGEACAIWEKKCAQGAVPPSPFFTDGRVGQNEVFSLSAVREWLRLEKQQAKQNRGGGGDNGVGRGDRRTPGTGRQSELAGQEGVAGAASFLRVQVPPSDDHLPRSVVRGTPTDSGSGVDSSGSRGGARRAWPAGSTTSNAAVALAKFVKRKGLSGTPQVQHAQAVAAKGRVRETAEVFLERMRPAGEQDTPAFVQRLKAGTLDAAEDFWR